MAICDIYAAEIYCQLPSWHNIGHCLMRDVYTRPKSFTGINLLGAREGKPFLCCCHSTYIRTVRPYSLDTVQDFLIKLGIKPRLQNKHFFTKSCHHQTYQNYEVCKICTFKVMFQHQKSTESFWIFFSLKNIWLGDQLL